MGMIQLCTLKLNGVSTLCAWRRGVIPALMMRGATLAEAQKEAERLDALNKVLVNHNLITTLGFQMVAELLREYTSSGLTYHAFGTGSTSPTVSDTVLTTEVKRRQFDNRINSGSVLTLSAFYSAAESTYEIEEAGIFGGSTATSVADTGVLFSHYLQSYDNSSGASDLTFDYNLTIG